MSQEQGKKVLDHRRLSDLAAGLFAFALGLVDVASVQSISPLSALVRVSSLGWARVLEGFGLGILAYYALLTIRAMIAERQSVPVSDDQMVECRPTGKTDEGP
jgi:hypothetical protein